MGNPRVECTATLSLCTPVALLLPPPPSHRDGTWEVICYGGPGAQMAPAGTFPASWLSERKTQPLLPVIPLPPSVPGRARPRPGIPASPAQLGRGGGRSWEMSHRHCTCSHLTKKKFPSARTPAGAHTHREPGHRKTLTDTRDLTHKCRERHMEPASRVHFHLCTETCLFPLSTLPWNSVSPPV